MRAIAILLAVWGSQAFAQFGYFTPKAYGAVQVVMHDTQVPNLECLSGPGVGPLLVAQGLTGSLAGCMYQKGEVRHVVLALSPGPFWAWQAQMFLTPNMVLGHEMRHVWEGDYHGVLPFVDRK